MKHWIRGIGFVVLSAAGVALGAEPVQTAQIKEQLVKLLTNITMTLNHAVDEPFCRQFFEDFKKQDKKVEHVQPIVQADRFDDPALTAVVGKCPTVKWIGAEVDEPPHRLNTKTRDQFGNLSVGTTHFRLYHMDIDNNKQNGKEHVFYSDGFVPEPAAGEELPPVDELDKTMGQYVSVDVDNCATLGGVTVGMGWGNDAIAYNGVIRYHERFYIYDLYTVGGLKLSLHDYTKRRKNFTVICRYWQ